MALFNKKQNKEEEVSSEQRQPTNEEQMMRRQSAPRPTAEQEAQKLYDQQRMAMLQGQGMGADGAVNGFKALAQVIGKEQIQQASLTLQKYKEGKANLEKKIVDNEQWYKLRHWECMRADKNTIQPSSAWLFNCIANKHADAIDRKSVV